MNELQVFNNDEFGTVRTLTIDDEPWFVGKDVAEILGYSNPRKAISDHVDSEDKGGNEMLHPRRKSRFDRYQRIGPLQPYPFQQDAEC